MFLPEAAADMLSGASSGKAVTREENKSTESVVSILRSMVGSAGPLLGQTDSI